MRESRMAFDRYHATMGNFSLTEHAKIWDTLLADKMALFYVTQRKLPFAPCVGHERLLENLITWGLDVPRLRFLREDKAGLELLAMRLSKTELLPKIRAVSPGTIVFAKEPIADVEGPFAETQMMEVRFEHAFDEPMTWAGLAMEMRLAAGERWLSDFSLRRDGGLDRAVDIAKYYYIGGFNDTSNMEAAFLLDINAVGTMAHYLVQAFMEFMKNSEKDPASGKSKHFEQVAFERWLDAHPNGTTLLLDTVSVKRGTVHAIRAAKSSEKRRRALKAVRLDSGNLVKYAKWIRSMLDANDLADVKIILTSDLDAKRIRDIVAACPFVYGFGVGTKLAAEVENVAGVIFKLAEIDGHPTAKCSETSGKETFPGKLQVWRYVDAHGFYIKDIIARYREDALPVEGAVNAVPLLQRFLGHGITPRIPSIQEQREYVAAELKRFRDIYHYPVEVSPRLRTLQKEVVRNMQEDEMGEEDILTVEFPS